MKKVSILLCVLCLNIQIQAQCTAAGPNNPSVAYGVFSLGKPAWINLSNVFLAGSQSTIATALLLGDTTENMIIRGFGLSVPSTASICGIKVEIQKSRDGLKDNVQDGSVKIIKGGTITGTEHRYSLKWPRTDSIVTYGGSGDLWGTTWTYADINSANFGIAISASLKTNLTPLEFLTLPVLPIAKVNHAKVTVYYRDALPIELLHFEASCSDEQTLVTWKIGSQVNNDFFTIERSANGIDYEKIGMIKGEGTSNAVIDYAFTDHAPPLGTAYYRLKQTDFNGDFQYFDPLSTDCHKHKPFVIYPNPAADEINMFFDFKKNKSYQLLLCNAYGNILLILDDIDSGTVKIDRGNISKGLYFIKLQSGDETIEMQRLILK